MSIAVGFLPGFSRDTITDPDAVAELARTLEAAGVESVWAVEHILVADDYEPLYPYSDDGRMPGRPDTVMPDPLEWLSFVAACTTTLRLGTAVVVLTQHPPVIMAKRVATLDALSRGRVVLGVGIGWQKEEYAAVNVPYARRGARLDEYVAVLRELWGHDVASYDGEFVRFDRVRSDPKPHAGRIPIVIGGSTDAAARRAGRTGDGWMPYVISPDDYAARVGLLHAAAREAGRDPAAVELSMWPTSWQRGATFDRDLAQRYVDAGVTRLLVSAHEAAEPGSEGVKRLVGEYLERVVGRLRS